ncbi:MAG: ABC transporter permease [Victivallales bacterium]|nr:ABC transporter permease [Victivallales bacterium]
MSNGFLWQFQVLLARNFRLFAADRIGVLLVFVQPIAIALLMNLALWNIGLDSRRQDENLRRLDLFFQKVQESKDRTSKIISEPRRLRIGVQFAEEVRGQAGDGAKTTADGKTEVVISPASATGRATVFFVLIAASIWMGLLCSCKEVVTEWAVIHRESHSTFSPGAYVLSKLVVLGGALMLQTLLLTAATVPALLGREFGMVPYLGIFGVNWLTALCACAMGLLVSCLIGSIRWALALVPVLMMPQILMGGLLRPPAQIAEAERSVVRDALSAATFQRWAFEAALIADAHFQPDTSLAVCVPDADYDETKSLLYLLQIERFSPYSEYFFAPAEDSDAWRLLRRPLSALLGMFVACAFLTKICLVLRICRANHGG